MNITSLWLVLVGTGLMAKGWEYLPSGTVPHNLARKRAQGKRRQAGMWMIGIGVALLMLAITLGDWR